MKNALKIFALYLAITIAVMACIYFLSNYIFWTVFNAIVGEEYGAFATIIFMHIVIPIITAGFTYVIKIKDPVTHREYLKEMEGKEYDKKADRQYILHSKMFRTECISYAIIFIFISLIGDPWFLLYALYSVLFVFYDLWMWMHLHKKWCNERFRK